MTMDDWLVMSRCNRVAKQLFSRNQYECDKFARFPYQCWTVEGITPEELRDRRAPDLSDQARLRKWKQKKASEFYVGVS